jgi:hypothetical protein
LGSLCNFLAEHPRGVLLAGWGVGRDDDRRPGEIERQCRGGRTGNYEERENDRFRHYAIICLFGAPVCEVSNGL